MSRPRLIKIGIALIAVAAVYLTGYLPQRGERVAAEARLQQLEPELAAAQGRLRVSELLGRALALKEAAVRNDFGYAGQVSSSFFDAVRAESMASPDQSLRAALNDVLARRDGVTMALARAEPGSVAALMEIEGRLRTALGYPTGSPQ